MRVRRPDTIAIPLRQQQGGRTSAGPLGSAHEPARSLYIHVPFCFHKCHYCDFYSFVDSRDRQPAFVEALVRELDGLAAHAGALETVFVGGGTPSLLRPELWERLLGALRERFDLRSLAEFTVECNPETVTPELMRTLAGGGVGRVSVGAQTFDPRHLRTLERWHEPRSVERALSLARDAGIARRSIDLIYAIPGQSMEDLERDLDALAALARDPGLEHVSCYALTYEPNTPMTVRMERGDFDPADEDLEARMMERVRERLAGEGLARYEISNFARTPEAQSLHNLAYWRQRSWLAAGPSASAHLRLGRTALGSHRYRNAPRLTDWMEGVERTGFSPIADWEGPDPARLLRETIMLGLRLDEGLDAEALRADAREIGAEAGLVEAAEAQERAGLLVGAHGARWRLSDAGAMLCNRVVGALMDAVGGG